MKLKLALLLALSSCSSWDSRSFWQGYADGIRAGCGTLVYDIDGQYIPERIALPLFEYADKKNLCEELYNVARKGLE